MGLVSERRAVKDTGRRTHGRLGRPDRPLSLSVFRGSWSRERKYLDEPNTLRVGPR
jgi:hypothetical protein